MFTGIVEELGTFVARRGDRSRFSGGVVLDGARLGDSIAVNGCCLTLVEQGDGWWEADLSSETLARTCLGALREGDVVNLERPMQPDGRLGGHIVLGHVDAVGTVRATPPELAVTIPLGLSRYCVEKGSITIDGVSLTIVSVADEPAAGLTELTFAIIPHTAAMTTLGHKPVGAPVDVEVDVVAKHVEKLIGPYVPAHAGPLAPDAGG
jgi:riboflavin synthase